VARTPHRGVRDSSQGSGPCLWKSRTLPEGLVHKHRGPALSHGGPDPLLMPWGISSSLATWPPRVVHVVGSGAACHSIRDSRVGTAPSYRSRGYPCFRVPTVALGPTSGEDTSLQVGPKLDWRLACRYCALADLITASPPSVTPTATSILTAD
jgi:hypothetical protein